MALGGLLELCDSMSFFEVLHTAIYGWSTYPRLYLGGGYVGGGRLTSHDGPCL